MVALLSRDVISVSRWGGNRWWMQLDGLSSLRKKYRQRLDVTLGTVITHIPDWFYQLYILQIYSARRLLNLRSSPDHILKVCILQTARGNFTKFTSSTEQLHGDTELQMNWLDFEVKRSEVKVTSTANVVLSHLLKMHLAVGSSWSAENIVDTCLLLTYIISGVASAVKEPGHFEVRKSSSQVTRSQGFYTGGHRSRAMRGHRLSQDFLRRVHFFPQKSWRPFLVVALKTQAANAADCFTVEIKQIKRSDMATFLFSVHTANEAKQ